MKEQPRKVRAARAPAIRPASAPTGLDLGTIRALAELVETYALSELELERDGARLRLRRGPTLEGATAPAAPAWAPAAAGAPAPPPMTAPLPTAALAPEEGSHSYITSPFVGTFYRAPSPEAPPYVEVGQRIKKGQVLCLIEAMKLMNEIEAEIDGTLLQALVDNGKPVEYGEPLFKIGT